MRECVRVHEMARGEKTEKKKQKKTNKKQKTKTKQRRCSLRRAVIGPLPIARLTGVCAQLSLVLPSVQCAM